MNSKAFQQLCELNQAFDQILSGLREMETSNGTLPETVRQRRAEIVGIQVATNRDFINRFAAALDAAEESATKRLRQREDRDGDREDVYVQLLEREAARKRKGLPPRVTILPNWDSGDEERYGEAQAGKRGQVAQKAKRRAFTRSPAGTGPGDGAATRTSTKRGGA